MSLQKTSKVRLYVSQEQKHELLLFLQERSCFEPCVTTEKIVSRDISQIDFAINFLSRFEPEKKGLRNAVLGDKVEVSEVEVLRIIENYKIEDMVGKIESLESEYSAAEKEKKRLEAMEILYRPWKGLSEKMVEGDTVSPFFIVVPKLSEADFLEDISSQSDLFDSSYVDGNNKFSYLLVYFDTSKKDDLLRCLSHHKGENIAIDSSKSPQDIYSEISSDLLNNDKTIEALNEKAQGLSKENLDSLKILYDDAVSKEVVSSASEKIESTKYLAVVEGWMSVSDTKMIQYDLQKKFSAFHMEEILPEEGEIVPVVLSQSGIVASAGEITSMYGTPASDEIDPTPYLAFFYILFFGMCLTDAGYGFILAALTGGILSLNLPLEKSVKNVITLFMYSGISTIIMGILFGGYFGITPEQVPESLTYLRDAGGPNEVRMFLGQIFNPMTDLVSYIMPITYGIGLIHLLLGSFLSGKTAWDNGNKDKMIFVFVPILFSFIFGGALALGYSVLYPLIASIILLIWGLGKSGNPIIRMGKGLFGLLNEILSWFQSILSYSRLFALGLATGVIALAFNMIAGIFGDLIPGIGGVIVMIAILIFGHCLNIVLNLLGAYVHSSRLQFVEFFGLFLEGGGRIFKPLTKIRKFRFFDQ